MRNSQTEVHHHSMVEESHLSLIPVDLPEDYNLEDEDPNWEFHVKGEEETVH